ncbi:response regulator [Pseudogemmobacter sp. W21_MBD1_M6]|uniref:response regulator n=1 Tax=Pseudogemmobacter sp. W21_MBD1_M6 TaxID=3240271 RepID=UPI003F985C48
MSVAFVDDHPILLSGIKQLFSTNSDFRIVGVGVCADDVLDIVGRERPDVIVVDLNMPGKVLEAICDLVRMKFLTKVLVFTAVTSVDRMRPV